MDTVFSVDESYIRFTKGDMTRTVFIVLGNDRWDSICDHSTSDPDDSADDFEDVMNKVDEYSNSFDGA